MYYHFYMSKNTYFLTVALIFSVIGILHVLRLWFGWEAIIGGWMVSVWISWAALAVAFYFAWEGFRFRK